MLSHGAAQRKLLSHPLRRGITLLEVLIAMFVLMFGLLGVASLLPVGKYHASRSLGYDQAAAVGQAAYQEIQVRGLLQPLNWTDSSNTQLTANSLPPFQFDPVATTPITGMTLVKQPGYTLGAAGARVFLPRDDLSVVLPKDGTLPAVQSNSAASRNYQGEYSWMFTVAPGLDDQEGLYVVSIVVFRGRDPSRERTLPDVNAFWTPEGRVVGVNGTDEELKRLKKGNWVMLSVPSEGFYSWYRIQSIVVDDLNGKRNLGTKGRSYNASRSTFNISLFDQVVMVYERTMQIEEFDSLYSVLP